MAEEVKTTTTEAPVVEQKVAKSKGKKGKRIVTAGEAHIQATFNNTIISVTDKKGEILTASSAGANGFRGSKKGTAYAAQIAAEKVAEIAKRDHGMGSIDVFVKGIGLGRDSAVRAFGTVGISINSVTDKTPIPHGGVRPKGERKP
ncbi:MAG: 30S ribosomal protein S11 [Candidatus Saccharimonadales bacterium]